MRLPKSLIKKYGISKKAWSIFRGRKHKARASKSYKSHLKIRRGVSMKKGSFGKITPFLAAGIYGGLRERISLALAPMTSKIPLGDVADEVGMLGVAYVAKRFLGNKVPMLKDVATAAMLIESARIGESVMKGNIFGVSSSLNTASNYVYG